MSTETLTVPAFGSSTETSGRHRVALLAAVLGGTALAAVPAGLLFPETSPDGTVAYATHAGERELWWSLLTVLGCTLVINVPLQALATMLLVRRRGSAWATIGAVAMWLGAALQGIGLAGWAAVYYFPTDRTVAPSAGAAVFTAVNHDLGRVLGIMVLGALLVALGTVFQSVALFRSHVVPAWAPLLTLFVVPTFVISGNGALGLVTSVPMAAAATGLGYYAWRRVA